MENNTGAPASAGLTERDVIIIACVCGVIIVTLLTILVVFVCRRKRNNQQKDTVDSTPRTAPVNGSAPNINSKKSPSYETTDGPYELRQNGYLPNYNGNYHPSRSVPYDTSNGSQYEKQLFENEMNRNIEKANRGDNYPGRPGDIHFHGGVTRSPSKDKYIDLEEKKDSSLQSGQESGYSTPDPAKPKKVIYEVIV